MSKAALSNLVDLLEESMEFDIGKSADEKSIKAFRRSDTNRYANAFRMRKRDFAEEVIKQINAAKTTGAIEGPMDRGRIRGICNKYFELIKATMIARISKKADFELQEGIDEFTLISWVKRDLSSFDAITQQTIGSKAVLRKNILQPMMEEINTTLKSMKKGFLDPAFSTNFNLGHQEGSNVQYFIADRLRSALNNVVGSDQVLKERVLEDISLAFENTNQKAVANRDRSVIIDAEAKFHNRNETDLSKIITLSIESKIANQGKEEDRGVREDIIAGIKQFVKTRPINEWVEQEASDSIVRAVAKTLMQEAAKKGFNVADKSLLKPIDKKPSSVRKKRLVKNRVTVPVSKFKANIETAKGLVNTNTPPAAPSYYSIINLINSKLPPKVRSNMGNPRLNNVSGRLSESARVINIITTPQGFPSIEYTYQRDPYDVFDPILGKKPWNTPGRNPRELIDKSVRELAIEIGMGRFYTRRV